MRRMTYFNFLGSLSATNDFVFSMDATNYLLVCGHMNATHDLFGGMSATDDAFWHHECDEWPFLGRMNVKNDILGEQ